MKFDKEWSAQNALNLARLSQISYDNFAYVVHEPDLGDFPYLVLFDRRETQGFVAANDDCVVLAFRGTEPESLRDWMTDADAIPTQFLTSGLHVHAGFARALEYVWKDVTEALAPHKGKPLYITGHSLGAALATLACVRLRWEQQLVHAVCTFGSPRVGQQDFCAAYTKIAEGSPTYRYVNDTDIVPRVPTRLEGYGHVGTLFYFGPDGKITPDHSAWQQFLLDVRGTSDDFLSGRLGSVENHRIGEYVKRCQQNL